MKTHIAPSDDLEEAIFYLKSGTPIAFPTETVYGLGVLALNSDAVKKIFTVKGRPSDNPLIVHVASLEQAISLSQNLPPVFFSLAGQFWPGPLTLIVERHPSVPSLISGGLPTIAIRMPSHPIARALIEKAGPIAAPSANLSGNPSPTSALHVLEDLEGKIPLIIDGGECQLGIESTVVSLLQSSPILLRPGTITKEEIEAHLGQIVLDPRHDTKILSPGMKYRHYAPKAKVRLVYTEEELLGEYILSPNPKEGIRLLNEKTLYAEFRRADKYNIREIVIDCTKRMSRALMNRIEKAANL